MSVAAESIGMIAVGFDGCDPERRVWHIGPVVGYMAEPTVVIETPAGQVHWASSLCRLATHDEEVEYWRKRALAAEAKQ